MRELPVIDLILKCNMVLVKSPSINTTILLTVSKNAVKERLFDTDTKNKYGKLLGCWGRITSEGPGFTRIRVNAMELRDALRSITKKTVQL